MFKFIYILHKSLSCSFSFINSFHFSKPGLIKHVYVHVVGVNGVLVSSSLVRNHTCDKQIRLLMHGRLIFRPSEIICHGTILHDQPQIKSDSTIHEKRCIFHETIKYYLTPIWKYLASACAASR